MGKGKEEKDLAVPQHSHSSAQHNKELVLEVLLRQEEISRERRSPQKQERKTGRENTWRTKEQSGG